jgi:hypothetical protein
MKKKRNKIIEIIVLLFFVIVACFGTYYIIQRSKSVDKIDFSLCKDTCNYKVLLNNSIYELKYTITDTEYGAYPGFVGKVYLNNVKIMTTEEYGKINKVRVFKDLLIFEEHVGTSADGDTIKIYDKNGKLLKSIYILDNKTGMHVSRYYNGNSASDCIDIKDDDLIVYGTMKYDGGSLNINGEFYEGWFQRDLGKMVDNQTLLATDPFVASYKISYEEIKNNGNLNLYITIKTVGEAIEETE